VSLIWNKYYDGKVPHATREVGSFWWKDVQRLNTIFRGIARCTIGDGTTLTFWEDLWTDEILAHHFPRLYSFARNSSISVNEVLSAEDLDSLFWLPLSEEAFDELQSLQDVLMTQTFDEQTKDVWLYQWGNATYSSRKLYKLAFQNVPAHPIFAWLWKFKCTPRVKFFVWLVLVDRLNTKVMLKRRNLFDEEDNAHCVLCAEGMDEDLDHLFFECDFSKRCWEKIGIEWNNNISLYQGWHMQGSNKTPHSSWKQWSLQPGRSGSFGMIECSMMVLSMLTYGLGILKTNVCFSLFASKMILDEPFVSG
jgi:hypothetical protein